MTQSANPYESPQGSFNPEHLGVAPVRIFSMTARLGRLRYFAYSMYINLAFGLFMVLSDTSGVIFNASNNVLGSLQVLPIYVVLTIAGLVVIVRRLHDLNRSGWWSIIMLLPLVNLIMSLYLLAAGGTQGANRFGSMPSSNTWITWVYGFVVPLILCVMLLGTVTYPLLKSTHALPDQQLTYTRHP